MWAQTSEAHYFWDRRRRLPSDCLERRACGCAGGSRRFEIPHCGQSQESTRAFLIRYLRIVQVRRRLRMFSAYAGVYLDDIQFLLPTLMKAAIQRSELFGRGLRRPVSWMWAWPSNDRIVEARHENPRPAAGGSPRQLGVGDAITAQIADCVGFDVETRGHHARGSSTLRRGGRSSRHQHAEHLISTPTTAGAASWRRGRGRTLVSISIISQARRNCLRRRRRFSLPSVPVRCPPVRAGREFGDAAGRFLGSARPPSAALVHITSALYFRPARRFVQRRGIAVHREYPVGADDAGKRCACAF